MRSLLGVLDAVSPIQTPALPMPARQYLPDGLPVWEGNRVELLKDGVEAYPAMLEAIRGAKTSVQLETYMFIDDAVGRMFGRALVEVASRGVEVKVLYDAMGSWGARRRFFRELREKGVQVHSFRPFSLGVGLSRLLRRDHRKLLVVDERVAFVGGVNIASHWAPRGEGDGWRDDVLQIEGPAVGALRRRFGASWRVEARSRSMERRLGRCWPLARGRVRACVVSSRRRIHQAYLVAIGRAQRAVLLAAAYFIPDGKMIAALEAAAKRGVEVTLLLAGKTDHPMVLLAGQALYQRLVAAGVRIHEWQESVLHAKTAVVDGAWGTVGSFNLERLSLRFNYELNVVFSDVVLGADLERSIRADIAASPAVVPEQWNRRPRWRKWLERFAWTFRKLL